MEKIVTFKLPEGAVTGAPIYFYSRGFTLDDVRMHWYYNHYKVSEVLAQGTIISVSGKQASVGWLRMVQRSEKTEPWEIGDLASGGMDAFRDVDIGGVGFQLIPIFRWHAPKEAFDLLQTILERRALPIQVTNYAEHDGRMSLFLATLSGQEFSISVAIGARAAEAAPMVLEAVGKTDTATAVEWVVNLVMPDGRLLQPHDKLSRSTANQEQVVNSVRPQDV